MSVEGLEHFSKDQLIEELINRQTFAGIVPLRLEEGGVIRVGSSRVSLDLVIEQYENGMAPEDLVRAYDTLKLADVYAAIWYYLNHRDELQAYLLRRSEEAEALRTTIDANRKPAPSREELLTRRVGEQDHAPVGR